MSSYRMARGGGIELLQAVAGDTGVGSAPADTAISADGRHLFVRNGHTFTISAFDVAADGGLTAGPMATDLPAAAVGLAAN
jgi:6-phosphogluconolactonase (cycloisomerase 2 family)